MRLSYGVKVTGFSSALSRYKVRDKLLHLSENCGGAIKDVCDIKGGTARIRFRTFDAAARYVPLVVDTFTCTGFCPRGSDVNTLLYLTTTISL